MAAKKKTTKRKTTSSRPKSKFVAKKLTKSKSDKMISGVLGGIAAYLQIDSTILRLLWIAVVAFTGFIPGILAYVIAVLVVPES